MNTGLLAAGCDRSRRGRQFQASGADQCRGRADGATAFVVVTLPLREYQFHIWHDHAELLRVPRKHNLALLQIMSELLVLLLELCLRGAEYNCWRWGLTFHELQQPSQLLHLRLLCLQLRTQKVVVFQQCRVHISTAFQLFEPRGKASELRMLCHGSDALLVKLLFKLSAGTLGVLELLLQHRVL